MNILLGQHNDVVEAIFTRLESIKNGDMDSPRVLVLIGESGIGKSRIVREVYEELRRRQPEPGYWPSLLPAGNNENSNSTNPMASRKVLGPDPVSFGWGAGAVPSFGWWHFECEIMESHNAVNVIGTAYPQLRAHLPALGIAWNDRAGFSSKIGRTREKLIEEARTTAMDGGFEALDALGLVFPGMGTLIRWAGHAGSKIANNRQQRRQLESDVSLASDAHVSAAKELAEAIRSTALPGKSGLPQIVVIEDMHRMGDDLAELVTHLSQPDTDRPVLVIGTAWPEGSTNPAYEQWMSPAVTQGRAEPVMVKQLGNPELITLLRHYAKNTDEDTARQVVERMPNPHFLKLWLTMLSTKRRISANDEALVLSEGELSALPHEVTDVLRQRWLELPDEVQQSLIFAVASRTLRPDSRAPGDISFMPRFLPTVVSEASRRAGLSPGDLEESLRSAVSPGAWCNTDSDSQWMREPDLQDLVLSYARNSSFGLATSEHLDLQRATRDVLIDWIDERREGISLQLEPDVLVAVEWLNGLPPAEGTVMEGADIAAQWALAQVADWNYDLVTAIEKARIVLDQAMLDTNTKQIVCARLAFWIGESGRYEEAVQLYRELLEDQLQTLSAHDPAVLATKHHFALYLFYTGRAFEALVQEQEVLADRRRILGADHPDTLIAHNNVACWHGETGLLNEAIEQLQELLVIELRVLGAEDRGTLLTRGNLLGYRRQARLADTADAIEEYQGLLLDQTRVLGADHQDTLSTRDDLAGTHAEAGDVSLAVEQLRVLALDSTRAIGAAHPLTLMVRSNFARYLGDSGEVEEAVKQFHEIVEVHKTLDSQDNPDSLNMKSCFAAVLSQAGRLKEAVEQARTVLSGSIRIYGSTHQKTLRSMDALGVHLANFGLMEEAAGHLGTALLERTQLLGASHVDTVQTQENLDACLQMQKDVISGGRFEPLPKHADGTPFAFYLAREGHVVLADTRTELVEDLIEGYADLPDTDAGNDEALYMRYRSVTDVADQIQQIIAAQAVNDGTFDHTVESEDNLTAIFTPCTEKITGFSPWNHVVPLILISTDYAPFTSEPLPQGNIKFLNPFTETTYLDSLNELGVIDLYLNESAIES
jgi:tetratricopeptide (TPR) repeat protein